MKHCEIDAALLDLYIDGELSPEELGQVQAHLEICPACRAYVDDALTISAAFPSVEDTPVPPDFAAGVMARLQAEQTTPKQQKKTPWLGLLASLAACCAIVILQQTGPLSGAASETAAYDTAAVAELAEAAPADTETAARTGDSGKADLDSADESLTREGAEHDSAQTVPAETEDASTSEDALYLTAEEAGDLLASHTPVAESEQTLGYLLTEEEYQSLLAALPETLRLNAPAWEPSVMVFVEK